MLVLSMPSDTLFRGGERFSWQRVFEFELIGPEFKVYLCAHCNLKLTISNGDYYLFTVNSPGSELLKNEEGW